MEIIHQCSREAAEQLHVLWGRASSQGASSSQGLLWPQGRRVPGAKSRKRTWVSPGLNPPLLCPWGCEETPGEASTLATCRVLAQAGVCVCGWGGGGQIPRASEGFAIGVLLCLCYE